VQARVVNSFREGPGLTLQIDKGSAAGIHMNDSGTVLDGAGDEPLANGNFKIVKVLGENKCIGSAPGLRSLGKNNRVSITLGK
jgi:hypothetical protein